jgi:signal transduction histidine kinase
MTAELDVRRLLLPHGEFRIRVLLAIVRHHWFIRLRWMMVMAALLLLLVERFCLPQFRRPAELMTCIGVLAGINVVWTLVSQWLLGHLNAGGTPSSWVIRRVVQFANAQMTVDLLLLTVILRYSGGVENPMSVFYLFHTLIAALLLRPLNALLQGGWALVLFGTLGFGECLGRIAPHYPFVAPVAGAALYANWDYVLAGIGVLGAGIFGTLYFTLQISSRLDEQEYELERNRDAVELLQQRRSRFMQTSAHQLKSPLTGIEMLAGMIRDRAVPAEQVPGIITRIIRRCQAASVQVNELLTLARVQDEAASRHRTASTDVRRSVEHVAGRFGGQARSKGLTLSVDTRGCAGARAAVDPRDLDDCIGNLLENAIKYTPAGGQVWVAVTSANAEVRVSVKDTGMGIVEESTDELFEPYRRGNLALAADIPGSGLGLAIVREVAEQAGGRIEVRSTVGQGSEFTLSFPRCDAPEDGRVNGKAVEAESAPSAP